MSSSYDPPGNTYQNNEYAKKVLHNTIGLNAFPLVEVTQQQFLGLLFDDLDAIIPILVNIFAW